MASPKIKPVQVNGRTRYRFVVDIGLDPATGKRRQKTETHDRRKDAQAALAKIMHEVNRGTYAMPTKITMGEYLDEWLRSATRGKEAATARNYADALRPAKERLGAKLLHKVTTADIEDLIDWMLTSGRKRGGKVGTALSPRTVQLTLSRLRSALDSAVHRRLIEHNPAAPVRCPAQVKIERQPWTDTEVRVFLDALTGERLHAVMLLSLLGLRPAEVCGLRWSDVDLDAGTLRVEITRTLVATDHGMEVIEKGPKSASGRRTLPLPPQVTTALRAFKVAQAAEKLRAGEVYQDSGFVLVDELGAPLRTDWLRRQTYRLMTAAKVRKVRPYDARHAALTYLATNGVPDVIVSAWAGHADLSLAKRVYVHPSAKDLERGRDALAVLLG
ncbi:MAG: tyrosine-type recombinase/integrase [Pseudonocardiaceae bacterium]